MGPTEDGFKLRIVCIKKPRYAGFLLEVISKLTCTRMLRQVLQCSPVSYITPINVIVSAVLSSQRYLTLACVSEIKFRLLNYCAQLHGITYLPRNGRQFWRPAII